MASTDVREGAGEAGVDIAVWLQRLGLEQYQQAFRGNDIDREVLPELTAEDLISIGVTSAEALTRQGDHSTALATVREGLETQEQTGERKWEAELHRLEGKSRFGSHHCRSLGRDRRTDFGRKPDRPEPSW
jgi:hypothetical protein